ncbi:MAG: histidine kinase [Cytophagaceae bacterium]|nr:MAG: histidine kinase [Cytophagaceae bacterium]
MNTVRFFLLSLVYFPTVGYAQIKLADYSQSFPNGTLNKPETVGLVLAIPKLNNSFWTSRGTSILFDQFAQDASFKELRPKVSIARTTFDSARVHFFLHGVTKKNADNYQFRVIEYPSRNLIVPWKSITQLTDSLFTKTSGWSQMAYLGGYKAPLGSMLIVDVKKKAFQPIVATGLVAWESIRPVVASIYTSDNLDVFLQKLQYPWAKTRSAPSYSTQDLRLPFTNTNLIYVVNADIYAKNQIQYQLIRNDRLIRPWQDNEYANSFIWLKGFSPGQYRIQIRYTAQPQHVSEYSFIVEPAWYQSLWFKLGVGGVVAVLIALAMFVYLLMRQRRKTRQEEANKQLLQVELRALYAQLNPHFVFNALSSIQGLINRQDVKGANEYLSDFARLMRESLTHSGNQETSLQQELKIMETYLKLEQLRFGFHYTIQVEEPLDVYTTSLPSLVWQPLLENAVKHGVAPLQQAGQIIIRLEKMDNALILRITDNGKGMTMHEPTNGFGLKLTHDRINLLNRLNPDQPIALAINNCFSAGTEVTLTFTHWLL